LKVPFVNAFNNVVLSAFSSEVRNFIQSRATSTLFDCIVSEEGNGGVRKAMELPDNDRLKYIIQLLNSDHFRLAFLDSIEMQLGSNIYKLMHRHGLLALSQSPSTTTTTTNTINKTEPVQSLTHSTSMSTPSPMMMNNNSLNGADASAMFRAFFPTATAAAAATACVPPFLSTPTPTPVPVAVASAHHQNHSMSKEQFLARLATLFDQ
jgi:hypothetical protein